MNDPLEQTYIKRFFISHNHIPSPRRYYSKLSSDRLHKLMGEVSTGLGRLSPSGCSKNILAAKSNLDSEIEYAKHQIFTPDMSFTRGTPEISLSPSKNHFKLPALTISPSKKMTLKHESPSKETTYMTQLSLSPLSQGHTSRIQQIDKIIKKSKAFGTQLANDAIETERQLENNIKFYKRFSKVLEGTTIEQEIAERCKEHGQNESEKSQDMVKVAKALKRSKKVWKQNHIAFMKTIDRQVHSFPLLKKT